MTEATQPYGDVALVRINEEFLFHKNYNYNKILQFCIAETVVVIRTV